MIFDVKGSTPASANGILLCMQLEQHQMYHGITGKLPPLNILKNILILRNVDRLVEELLIDKSENALAT